MGFGFKIFNVFSIDMTTGGSEEMKTFKAACEEKETGLKPQDSRVKIHKLGKIFRISYLDS